MRSNCEVKSPSLLFSQARGSKVVKDPIHGDILLHPLLVKIIDTPQFQRLRRIRQTGPLEFVYPGSNHTRFQHCIGTSYLAGVFVQKLCESDPELPVDTKDALAVQIAGLLHDLGHGPFSHTFDGRFMPRAAPDRPRLHHEELSIRMFQHLLDENKAVRDEFAALGFDDHDILFIQELIRPAEQKSYADWPFKGRGREKAFLYEIVSNNLTGVDVDKFDYLARDAFHLGLQFTFDHMRYMTCCKVITDNGLPHIFPRDKEALKFVEALLKANEHFLIPSRRRDANGKTIMLRMSDCVDDMSAYQLLTDDVFSAIRLSNDAKLDEAKRILEDIDCRRIFAYVGKTHIEFADAISVHDVRRELVLKFEEAVLEIRLQLQQASRTTSSDDDQLAALEQLAKEPFAESDWILSSFALTYGNQHSNPMERMRFYSKHNPTVAFKMRDEELRAMLPMTFSERLLYAYVRQTVPLARTVAACCFRLWCKSTSHKVDDTYESYN